MADDAWFDNQRKRKHSDVDHNAATRVRQRHNESSTCDGDTSHTHPSPTRYRTNDPPAANIGPYSQQTSLFQGAHHFGIERATFHTTTNINSVHPPAIDAYSILHNAIAIEATHASKTASYAPKCNPQTRIQIISDIIALVKEGSKPLIWFSGPAGGGKTCIMRKVVERCQQEGLWTCSYFFSTRIAGLDKVDPFVATIVYQLMTVLPTLQPHILNAISRYPAVFRKSVDFQMDKLIVEPLISCGVPPSTTPYQVVIAIDGFDECRNEDERIHLLHILGSLHSRLPASILVSIIVASRPELDIRMAFDEPQLGGITQTVRLQSYNGMTDVAIYWHDELEKIRQTHPMRRLIPEDWPVEKILRTLIRNSSGQFILPAIIIKHISNPRYNPVERLKQVLSPSPSSALKHPLTELDALYTVILHPPEGDFQLMKRILHCIIGMSAVDAKHLCTPSFLDDLLDLPLGTVEAALSDLHSVLGVPSYTSMFSSITFHHKTLEDFLLSPDRAKDLYQAPHETHTDLTLACTHLLNLWATNPLVNHRFAWTYASYHWDHHFIKSFEGRLSVGSVSDILLEFDPRIVTRSEYFLHWPFYDRDEFEDHLDNLAISFEVFHTAKCPADLCLPLCRVLHQRHDCHDKLASFRKTTRWNKPYYGISSLLSRFDVETGLYGEDEANALLHPVGHRLLAIELDSIRQTHPLLVDRDNWPVKDILSTVMAQSPGNLLIPSIIIRYIDDPHQNPVVMLSRALAACVSARDGEQAKLDSLYTLILHRPNIDIPLMKSIFHMIIGLSSVPFEHNYHKPPPPTLSLLEGYLQLPPGAASTTLCHLYSIVNIPTDTKGALTFYHKSLEDYLLSPDRSLDLFQEPYQTRIGLTLASTHHLQKWADTPGIVYDQCTRHTTWIWDTLLTSCFDNELSPSSIELLEPILNFDPRIFWRIYFLVQYSMHTLRPVSKLCEMFHLTMCKNQSCLVFCRLLRRMDKCYKKANAIHNSLPGLLRTDREGRLATLHRFDIETGLYDEAEVEGFPYPKDLVLTKRFLTLSAPPLSNFFPAPPLE